MPLDGAALAISCGAASPVEIHHHLCRAQIDRFHAACAAGDPLIVACTQEAPLFRELQKQDHPDTAISFANIREHAGWSAEAADATAKIAALLEAAAVESPPVAAVAMRSGG